MNYKGSKTSRDNPQKNVLNTIVEVSQEVKQVKKMIRRIIVNNDSKLVIPNLISQNDDMYGLTEVKKQNERIDKLIAQKPSLERIKEIQKYLRRKRKHRKCKVFCLISQRNGSLNHTEKKSKRLRFYQKLYKKSPRKSKQVYPNQGSLTISQNSKILNPLSSKQHMGIS